MTDWLGGQFTAADFDASLAPRGTAKRVAADEAAAARGEVALFAVPTPVTRPKTAPAPERLPGEVSLFAETERPAECTPEQAAQWQERYQAGYSYGRMDGRAGKPRADVLLSEIPPEDPHESGSVYCVRHLDLAFRIAYTRAYRFEIARQTGDAQS